MSMPSNPIDLSRYTRILGPPNIFSLIMYTHSPQDLRNLIVRYRMEMEKYTNIKLKTDPHGAIASEIAESGISPNQYARDLTIKALQHQWGFFRRQLNQERLSTPRGLRRIINEVLGDQ